MLSKLFQKYIDNYPFGGEREDSRQRTLKVVRVRISHKCADGGDIINKGDFAVVEQAIIDNEWKRCYVCFGCIKRNAIDVNGYTEEEFKNLK